MARITVEDCLEKISNRFELVMVASKRARQLTLGAPSQVEEEKDKPTVIALREIASGKVDAQSVRDASRRTAEIPEDPFTAPGSSAESPAASPFPS